jgi:hypothetical protein
MKLRHGKKIDQAVSPAVIPKSSEAPRKQQQLVQKGEKPEVSL